MAEMISMMTAFARQLEKQMQSDSSIRVLTADLVGSCGLKDIETHYPNQFVNTGIAEQNMVGIAAGLAKEGMKPFAYSFAAFTSMRACEQVRTDVFYNGLNVKVMGTHSGVSTGQAGSTHFSLEDIGILRSMPQSVVLVPSDPVSAAKTAEAMCQYPHGAYIRLDRNPMPALYAEDSVFEVGKGHVLKEGSDIVIFAAGTPVHAALEAAQQLEATKQCSVAVVDIYSVKPLDNDLVEHFLKTCSLAFAVEEHNITGGLFGAIAECSAQMSRCCPIHPIGIREIYPHGNTIPRARERLGLDADGIQREIGKYL